MFPFTISGKIRLKNKATFICQTVENEIASALMMNGSEISHQQDTGFRFAPGLVSNLSWDYLFGVSSGKVYCNEDSKTVRICYRLRFVYLYLAVSALIFACKYSEKLFSPVALPAEYYLWAWVWLIAGNIIFTICTFRCFLRKCAKESSGRVFFWHKLSDKNELPVEDVMLSSQNDSQHL